MKSKFQHKGNNRIIKIERVKKSFFASRRTSEVCDVDAALALSEADEETEFCADLDVNDLTTEVKDKSHTDVTRDAHVERKELGKIINKKK